MENNFIDAAMNYGMAYTENGAITNVSAGSELVDQFGKAGNYMNRNLSDVFSEQASLWEEDSNSALKFPFYLRMITRKTRVSDNSTTETVQKGQGLKDESLKRLLWVAAYHKDEFYKNIWILPIVGSWKDIWVIMYYDKFLKVNAIDNSAMFGLINQGLKSSIHCDLVKKFLPRIRSKKKCHTDWARITNKLAKDFANYNKISFIEYNRMKVSGKAHDFQKLICSKRYSEINWDIIPGKALSILTDGKFLGNSGLESEFTEWILKQDSAKFTGYVYELGKKVIDDAYYEKDKVRYPSYYRRHSDEKEMHLYQKVLANKQFDELIAKASADGKINGNVWCALDTSGSMDLAVNGNIRAIDICVSLGVFFSTLNKGAFHKNVIMFDDESKVMQLKGDFCDMIRQIITQNDAMGSTNFQSVIDEIVRIRENNKEIPIEDYPDTLLVVSDMQFNPTGRYSRNGLEQSKIDTNYQVAKDKLLKVFPKSFVDNFKIIWWDCTSRKKVDYPSTMEDGGTYLMSGFDGSIVSLLLGETDGEDAKKDYKPISMEEMIGKVLSQEVLCYVTA